MKDEQAYLLKFFNSGNVWFKYINPSIYDSAGCIYNTKEKALFFPVQTKYIKDANLENFTVRMGPNKGNEYILVTGELQSATSQEDIDYVFNALIKDWHWDCDKAQYSLFDKRDGKPRSLRHKLKIKKVVIHNMDNVREYSADEIL